MLQINSNQYKKFSKAELDKFSYSMSAEIFRLYPEKVWKVSESLLKEEIDKLIVQGDLYGLTTAYNLSRFIICSFELGLQFEQQNNNKELLYILLDKSKNQQMKMEQLDEFIFGL